MSDNINNNNDPIGFENKETSKVKIHSLEDMLNDNSFPPPQVISKGILPDNSMSLLYGAPKVGKSILAQNIGLALSNGSNWLDFEIANKYTTLIIQSEVNYYQLKDRIKIMASTKYPEAKNNLFMTEPISLDIYERKGVHMVIKWIEQYNPKVLIFDPLKDFHCLDENQNHHMAGIMGMFREIIEKYCVSIILVHHATKYKDSSGGANIRGASNIFGSVDSAIELVRDKNDTSKLRFNLRYDKQLDDMILVFNDINLHFEKASHTLEPENNSALMEIVTFSEPSGISITELQKRWMKRTDKGKSTFYATYNLCKTKLQIDGNKLHLLGHVLPL